jgi:hypothetical protein
MCVNIQIVVTLNLLNHVSLLNNIPIVKWQVCSNYPIDDEDDDDGVVLLPQKLVI